MTTLLYDQLHPRYWLARTVWWVWQDASGPWPTPALAHAMTAALAQSKPTIDALRAAESSFSQALEQQRQAREGVANAASTQDQHQRDLASAQGSARPRFEATDPTALAWREAKETFDQLVASEAALIERAEAYDRDHSTPDRAALLQRRYGQPDYQGNAVRKWLDDKLAASSKFEEYFRRRNALFLQIDRLERQMDQARNVLEQAQAAMETAWSAHGHTFFDKEALEQTQAIVAAATAAAAQAPARQAAADRAAMTARRQLTQALQAFHQQAGGGLWAAAQLARSAVGQRNEEAEAMLSALGDVDRQCFYEGSPRSTQDNERRERIRQAGMWFLGQGPAPALANGWTAWMALTYGHTDGLPGSAMAQAGMGLPPAPGSLAA